MSTPSLYRRNAVAAGVWLAAFASSQIVMASTDYSVQAADFEVTAEGGTPISTPGTVNGSACNTGSEGGCETSTTSISYGGGG